MFDRQYDGGAKLPVDLILNFIFQTITYFIQQGIMNSNQTPVDSNCLELQQDYTSWINFFDIILLVGMVTSVVLFGALCCGGPILGLAVIAKVLYYLVSGLLFLALLIWSQFILFTDKAEECSNKFVEVDKLRNVPFFWAIIFYISFGCCCCLSVLKAVSGR
jgi:hypothetical protein